MAFATFLSLLHYTSNEGVCRTVQNEQELVEAAKTDPAAFGLLFDAHYQTIFRYVCRRVGDAAAAQDIAAETFLKAYQHIETFTWRGVSFANWLYTIAGNEVRMYFRRVRKAPSSLDALFEAVGYEPESDIDLQAELQAVQEAQARFELAQKAQAVLRELPLKYQEVLTLRFAEQKKITDIAEILAKRPGTVKSLLSRGIKLLRTKLEANKNQKSEQSMQPSLQFGITPSEGHILVIPSESYEE